MYGHPIYSDGRSSDPVQREQGARFLAALRADPPAGQTDNRFLQSQRYTGVPYAATVGQVEEFFAKACYQADQRLGEPAACRWFLNWFDNTPRAEMRRELLAEVELALAVRATAGAA